MCQHIALYLNSILNFARQSKTMESQRSQAKTSCFSTQSINDRTVAPILTATTALPGLGKKYSQKTKTSAHQLVSSETSLRGVSL